MTRPTKISTLPALALAALSTYPLAANADESGDPGLDLQRWELRAGVFGLTADAKVGSTRDGRPSFLLDLGALGIDETVTEPWISLTAPIGSSWNVRMEYFGYHEDGTQTVQQGFEYDDLVVSAGSIVQSDFGVDLLIANFGYLWRTKDRGEFRVGLGVHMADLDYGIRATLIVNDIIISEGTAREELLAPLPNLYLGGAYQFSPRFLGRAKFGWLSLSYGDWDGELLSGSVDVEYELSDKFGVGIGYVDVDLDVKYDDSVGREVYELEMEGPLLFFRATF